MNSHATIQAAVSALSNRFETSYANGDFDALSKLHTKNVILLPAGSQPVRGQEEIRAFWQRVIDCGIKRVRLDIDELEQHGDIVVEIGRFTLFSADTKVLDQGRYMNIRKAEDGWKVHRSIWNSHFGQE